MRSFLALCLVTTFGLGACAAKATPEQCTAVADHLTRIAVGAAAAEAGSSDELLAASDAFEAQRKSPQYARMLEQCKEMPASLADCMLAAKDMAALQACKP